MQSCESIGWPMCPLDADNSDIYIVWGSLTEYEPGKGVWNILHLEVVYVR